MRLGLRRKLRPYGSLRELADALNVTMPRLKRGLRALELRGELSLSALAEVLGTSAPTEPEDNLYLAFHLRKLCLVCGSPLERARGRQAGWGEFLQCPLCDFSVHENADFRRSQEVARAQIQELRGNAERAQRILAQRKKQGRSIM